MKPYRLALAGAAAALIGSAGFAYAQHQGHDHGSAPPAAAAPAVEAPKSGSYALDSSHGNITWKIDHLGFSTYIGQFTGVTADLVFDGADPTKSTVSAVIPMSGILTGSEGLTTHLKSADFFDAEKFPTATFKSTKVEVTGANTGKITGDLTLHGVTRPVVLDVTFNKGAAGRDGKYKLGFDATTTITRSEFGISTYAPVLGDVVKLHIEAEFVAK